MGKRRAWFFSNAPEIIGRREDGFLVRSVRGEEVESDHSPKLLAPKFWQAGRSIATRVIPPA